MGVQRVEQWQKADQGMLKNNKYHKDIWNQKTETENHLSCLYRKIRRDICYVCLFDYESFSRTVTLVKSCICS